MLQQKFSETPCFAPAHNEMRRSKQAGECGSFRVSPPPKQRVFLLSLLAYTLWQIKCFRKSAAAGWVLSYDWPGKEGLLAIRERSRMKAGSDYRAFWALF
jgi:hypothetical protein